MSKKAFSLIEIIIVVTIIFIVYWVSFTWYSKTSIKSKYDNAVQNIILYIKEARTYWLTNHTIYLTWSSQSDNEIPIWWYWVEISNAWNWSVGLRLFYNYNNDFRFNEWDRIEKEWQSPKWSIWFSSMIWSWSSIVVPWWNSSWVDVAEYWNFTWTIIFKNDGNVYISSWNQNNTLKNIYIGFYMNFSWWKINQRRLKFDRIEKLPRIEYYDTTKDLWIPTVL